MALSSLRGRDTLLPEVNPPPIGQKPPQEVLIQPPPTVPAGPGQPLLSVSMTINARSPFLPAPFFVTYRAAFFPPGGTPIGASGAGEALRSLDAPLGSTTGIGQAQELPAAAAEPAPPSGGPATSSLF